MHGPSILSPLPDVSHHGGIPTPPSMKLNRMRGSFSGEIKLAFIASETQKVAAPPDTARQSPVPANSRLHRSLTLELRYESSMWWERRRASVCGLVGTR